MRSFFTIFLLSILTIGAIFFFRSSLEEALIAVNIEELAQHTTGTATADTDSNANAQGNTDQEHATSPTLQAPISKADQPKQEEITEPEKEVHTPPPLSKPHQTPSPAQGTLTAGGVVTATNAERNAGNLSSLSINSKLSSAAQAKLNNMFANQYFEHVSPDGTKPSDWVDGAGYAYRLTGENLALGDFSGDADLVTAWMNSPGHRANIMKADYTEIGVAVGRGQFNGRETWLAVQVFGKPLPSCDKPSESTKQQITTQQTGLSTRQKELEQKKAELDASRPKSGPDYNAKVTAYNTLVSEYNALAEDTKQLVTTFNALVNAYNSCMAN